MFTVDPIDLALNGTLSDKGRSAFNVVSSLPLTPVNGDVVLLSTDSTIQVYWGSWQILHTLTPLPSGDGTPIGLLLALTREP